MLGVHPVVNLHFRLFAVLSLSKGSGGCNTKNRGSNKPVPKKKHRTQQACIHLYNLPVLLSRRSFAKTEPAGHPTPRPPDPRPKYAKRTLNKTQATGLPPLYLTPTEVGETPTTQKRETKPIYTRPRSTPPDSAKQTQLHHRFSSSPLLRYSTSAPNTPNPPKNAKRTQFHVPPPPTHPKNTKRTQFTSAKMRNEPNYITTSPLLHFCPYHPAPQKIRNEPNFRVPLASRRLAHPQMRKTNPIRPRPVPNAQNKPNFHPTIHHSLLTIY